MSYLDTLNLSPQTLAGLAQIRGAAPPPPQPGPDGVVDAGELDDENSPEAWQAAAGPGGVKAVGPGQTYGDVQQRESGGDMTKYASPNIQFASGVGSQQPGPGSGVGDGGELDDEEPKEPTRDQVGAGMAVPSNPATTIPAHWQPGSHTVSMQRGMNPEELEQGQYYRDVFAGHGLLEGDKHLEAERQRGMADAVYAGAHAMMAQRVNDQMAAIQQRRAQYVANQQKKLEDLATEAQKQEDPKAFWKDQGTLGTILTGIMIGLGQFASMASGRGENAALKIVNDNIDRNIASQRANIANAHKAYDTASSLYEKNLAAFGDEERANLATKVQYLDQVMAMADAQRAQAGITDAEAANHGFLKSLYNQRAQAADDFSKLTHTQVAEQENEHFVPAQTVGGAGSAKREGNLVTTSDGTTYHFGSEKTADEAIKRIQGFDDVQRITNKILQIRKETMKLDPIVDKTQYESNMLNLKRLRGALLVSKSVGDGQGTVTSADYEADEKMGLDPTAGLGTFKGGKRIYSADYDAANHAFKEQAKDYSDRQRGFVQSAGGEIYQRDYMRDASGNLVPTGRYTGQDAKPAQRLAPYGSKPMNSREELKTDERPDSETTPHAPVRGGVYQSASGGGGGGKKKGDSAKAPKVKRR